MPTNYPIGYEIQNDASTKFLNMVVEFEGTDIKFGLVQTFKRVRFGDPGIYYGEPGLVWGGLLLDSNVLSLLSINSNLIINQKIEPEQGRGSAATMTLEFIDKDGYMTNFVAKNKVFDDIMGGKQVKVYLGYANTAFKEDYFVVFRGYVSDISAPATRMILQLTDANLKRRTQIFLLGKNFLIGLTKSFNPADINVITHVITLAIHGFQDGNRVQFTSTGTFPTGITAGTDYFIISATTNTFKISLTAGGTEVAITSQGTGVHTISLFGLGPFATIISVSDNADFVRGILGPDGFYDPSLKTYIKIDDEFMEYLSGTGFGTNQFTVSRGARNTTPVDHDILGSDGLGTIVENAAELQGNLIDLSLKIMLSGWGGPWLTGQSILSFVQTNDPDIGLATDAIILADDVDAVEDLGLSIGDYLTISGATVPSNNGEVIITNFIDRNGLPNNVITTNKTFTMEIPTSAVFSSRSQYDTLPDMMATKLRPLDVDVNTWQTIRRQFLSQPENTMRHFITAPKNGKDWIEKEYLLPAGAYGVTKFGRISMAITRPPLAGSNLVILDQDNIIEPQNIVPKRSLNNRRFFNEVQYFYDYDDTDNYQSLLDRIDTTSLNVIGTSSVLPIEARGLRTDLNASAFIEKRVTFLIRRYSTGAIEISLKTNWKAASLMEVSDIVALYDNGNLKIANFETGVRDIGAQLFEAIQRSIDIKSGVGTLTLLSQADYQINDRFAGIAPSSLVDINSTTSEVIIKDSFGVAFPFNEAKKWIPIIGDLIRIHSPDYTTYNHLVQLIGFVSGSNFRMLVGPGLPTPPLAGYYVNCAPYPNTTVKTDQQKSKLLFSFIDPTLTVVSGTSGTVFDVSIPDAAKVTAGLPVKIHNADYSINSVESTVFSVVGTTITVQTDFGFTPSAGQKVELVGFIDGNGPYRIL